MDRLQKYLHENKSSLDTDVPDEENWIKLSNKFGELSRTSRIRRRGMIGIGIAASLLLVAAGYILLRPKGTSNRDLPKQEISVNSPDPVPQAKAVNSTYSPAISRELEDLRKTSFYGHSASNFKVFSLQWKALEANEKTIEQNMRTVGPDSRLIQQLTDNYKLKIRLLQQFSIEINKVKNFLPPADTLIKVPSLSILSIKTSNYEKE